MQTTDFDEHQDIYTVSRLNNEVRLILEDTFPMIWVEGEISNFAAPHSGHWYFSLKDAGAQVRCALFRGNQRGILFTPKDGSHVLIRARVSLYPNRGEYQLIAEHMEERGEGKLRRTYELLKKKLEEAGLFDVAHKKQLPLFPQQIGVITSATGAAIRDILIVLKRRFPCVPVIIYPSLVQGATAALTIVKAIQTANQRNECDVLILARGGGSLEDLWPFNEEMVAHAIYQSNIPMISGVGHEVDFTIADFVADKRAATPSAAAEIAVPSCNELRETLARDHQHILRCIKNKISASKKHLHWVQTHLAQQHPKRKLAEKMQRLDFYELTLVQLQSRQLSKLQLKLNNISTRLNSLTPINHIHHLQNKMKFYLQRLSSLTKAVIAKKHANLASIAATLDALSPLATLQRGYAIATKNQRVIRSAKEIQAGDEIIVRISDGELFCQIEKVE